MYIKKTVSKIKLSKEQQEEANSIIKGDPVKKTRLVNNRMMSYPYQVTSNRPISKDMKKKRLAQLYGGICTGCGFSWPDFKVEYDYDGATRIERYCSPCLDKWKDKL